MIIDNPTISGSALLSGSLTITGSLNVSGSISGLASNAVSASYALISTSASYALVATSASQANNADTATSASYALSATSASYSNNTTSASYALNATTSSFALNATTSSFALASTSASYALASTSASYALNATTSSFALASTSASYSNNSDLLDGRDSLTFANTGSNSFVGTQNINGSVAITGSLTTTGAITAQTLNVQQVTSSIVYSSGSNIFGNSISNTQSMTGSVGISGSLAVVGAGTITGALTLNSTITNGTYTYTLPSATGTLALTSALSSYLPLAGGALTGALTGTSVTLSGNIIFDTTDRGIVSNTSDGSDNKFVSINGGGARGDTRGGGINIFGNESAGTGRIDVNAGDVVGGVINLVTAGLNRLTVNRDGTTTLAQALTGTSATFTAKGLIERVQVGTAATINDATGVGNTLQFANYSAGVFVTASADSYIYKTSGVFGGLSAQTLIFQTRSDVAGGGFAFVAGSTPSAVVTIASTGVATFASSAAGLAGMNITNSSATSYGLDLIGGDATRFALRLRNYDASITALTVTGSGAATFSSSIAVLSTGIAVTIDDGGKQGYTITNSAAVRTYKIIAGIDGTSNTGFSIRNVTAGRNELLFTDAGAATFSSSVTIPSSSGLILGQTSVTDGIISSVSSTVGLNFKIGTTSALYINGSATPNVGIGTTSPAYKLDIYSSSPATIGLKTDATYNSVFRDYIATTDSYLDITTERTDGGGFNFLLLVSSTLTVSGANRNYYTFAVQGRGTTATATQLSNVTAGTSARTAIAVSFPSNGVIRLTLTGAETCQIKVTAIGHGSL